MPLFASKLTLILAGAIYIYYDIVAEVQTTNKRTMHSLTTTDAANQANCIRCSKKNKVIKRKITITDEHKLQYRLHLDN